MHKHTAKHTQLTIPKDIDFHFIFLSCYRSYSTRIYTKFCERDDRRQSTTTQNVVCAVAVFVPRTQVTAALHLRGESDLPVLESVFPFQMNRGKGRRQTFMVCRKRPKKSDIARS